MTAFKIVITIMALALLAASITAFTELSKGSILITKSAQNTEPQLIGGKEDIDKGEILIKSGRPKDCTPLHFSPVALPHIALVSVPGSGNTWVRHLIQQATGIYTGSIYNETKLDQEIFPNDPKNNSVIVTKRHTRWSEKNGITKAILLVRTPFDAIVAAFNRIDTKNKTETAPKKRFLSKDWERFVSLRSSYWLYHGVTWLAFPFGPIHIVRYEELKVNLKDELRKICIFLGHPVSEKTLDCVVQNAEGAYKRKRTITDRSIFPPKIQKRLEADQIYFDYIAKGYNVLYRADTFE
ncbi:unnamed protein product [Owenia fusiformis]|uniref:Sulfotransferase domain-containing protein n=1 Tax=Owenia fusiformis TaxID=6347 RepID=A0A8S4PWR0_OWEFU|nr:unnamed protein product [Owenia fusiformis]